jgi:hypothetical protein
MWFSFNILSQYFLTNYAMQTVNFTAKFFTSFLEPVIAGEPSDTTCYTYKCHIAVQAPRQFVENVFTRSVMHKNLLKKLTLQLHNTFEIFINWH